MKKRTNNTPFIALFVVIFIITIIAFFFGMAARDKAAMEDYDRFLASPYYKECRELPQTCYKAYKKVEGGDKTQ